MCFFNSLIDNAEQIARRYRRRFDAVEAWKSIMAERESAEVKPSETGRMDWSEVYEYRLAEGMYMIPAFAEPHHIIVTDSDQLRVMDWGLIPRGATEQKKEAYINRNWHKNARAEDIFTKWPWKFLIRRQRCIMPSTGYFEYHYFSKTGTQPYFIFLPGERIFSFGGLWDEWRDPKTGELLHTFVQITTEANSLTRMIHNGGKNPFRMPLILHPGDEERWLDPRLTDEEIQSLLKPYPAGKMAAYPVYRHFKDLDPYDKRVIREEKDARQQTLELDDD